MRDIPKAARIDKKKHQETLEVFDKIIKDFIEAKDFYYDIDNIKNELSFFDDIPTEQKDLEIAYFILMIESYKNQNKNVQMVKEGNKKNKKYIKSIKTILDILDSLESKSTDTETIINFNTSILLLLNKASGFDDIQIAREVLESIKQSLYIRPYPKATKKEFFTKTLIELNRKYNLQKSSHIKSFVDKI